MYSNPKIHSEFHPNYPDLQTSFFDMLTNETKDVSSSSSNGVQGPKTHTQYVVFIGI